MALGGKLSKKGGGGRPYTRLYKKWGRNHSQPVAQSLIHSASRPVLHTAGQPATQAFRPVRTHPARQEVNTPTLGGTKMGENDTTPSRSACQSMTQSTSQSASLSVRLIQPAIQPASEPASRRVCESARQSPSRPVSQPFSQPAIHPAGQSANQPAIH